MGWLGLCLVFVGITLFGNGLGAKIGLDRKSTAYMNILTCALLVIGNLIQLARTQPGDTFAYNNIAAGLLFGFTYAFLAANHLWGLDLRAFGIYSLFASVFALVNAFMSFTAIKGVTAGAAGGPGLANLFHNGNFAMGVLWLLWSLLWLEGFAELLAGHSRIGRYFPALSMFEGVVATFIPGMLMLWGAWPM